MFTRKSVSLIPNYIQNKNKITYQNAWPPQVNNVGTLLTGAANREQDMHNKQNTYFLHTINCSKGYMNTKYVRRTNSLWKFVYVGTYLN